MNSLSVIHSSTLGRTIGWPRLRPFDKLRMTEGLAQADERGYRNSRHATLHCHPELVEEISQFAARYTPFSSSTCRGDIAIRGTLHSIVILNLSRRYRNSRHATLHCHPELVEGPRSRR